MNMRYMAKMLGNVRKPAADDHEACSSLKFALGYKALLSQFRENHTSIASDHEDSGSEGEEVKTVEKHTVFEIDIPALHYTRADGNYY